MDIIFEIGLYLMPFENLFFAPSAGWATITPIIFFVYLLFNLKYVVKTIYKYKYIFMFFLAAIILSIINYIFVGIEIKNFINAGITLGLGIIDFISLDIYFRQKQNKIDKCTKILLLVYTISLAIGWIQFITIKFNIEPIKQIFYSIEKRSYMGNNRIQFTFTEPSFIGMHLFGILLPIYLFTKEKKLIILIIAFAMSSIIFSSGMRILIDIISVVSILYIVYLIKNINNKKLMMMTIILILIGILGAMKEYKSSYTNEMEQLANPNFTNDSVSFCLYTRVVSEFGIIFLIIAITYIYQLSIKSNNLFFRNYVWILFYIYLQFESYGFYTIWLYIVLLNLDIKKIKQKI